MAVGSGEGDVRRVVPPELETMDALYHCAFDVLTPEAHRSLSEFLTINTHGRKVGELAIQYYFEDDKSKLSSPDTVSWAAFFYDFIVDDDDRLQLGCTGMLPQQEGIMDLSDNPRFADRPTHVLQWPEDIEYSLVQAWRIGHPHNGPAT